jgi:Protein of unknown function (DUF3168)
VSAESTIYGILSGYGPLTSLVGTRIYPEVIAQGEDLPAVVYSKTDSEVYNQLLGTAGITRHRFTVQSWSLTRDEAENVLDKAADALAAQVIPIESRAATFDTEVGLHAAALEFDYWA